MSNETQFLPPQLANKTVGIFGSNAGKFLADLERLDSKCVYVDGTSTLEALSEVDVFVMDCCVQLEGGGYPASAMSMLETYAKLAEGRFCYGIFPSVLVNSNWDVVNSGGPIAGNDCLPSARWIYDRLLNNFAARAVVNIQHQEAIPCIVTRLLPLKRTLLCVMATSGHGKTTLVRQLANQHGIFHTSSDFLLSSIVSARLNEHSSAGMRKLKEAISEIEPAKLWGRFFRLLEEDRELLECFLHMAWQHVQLGGEASILGFDIDLRGPEAKKITKDFFKSKDLKVWECSK